VAALFFRAKASLPGMNVPDRDKINHYRRWPRRIPVLSFRIFPNGNIAVSTRDFLPMTSKLSERNSQIGRLVRERRLESRLTQRELSELAGVGVRLVSELERGKDTVRMDAANRVLAVFGLTLGAVEAARNLEATT
jgi:HTH-type transcriptional regulator/antitoxin HipB